MSSGCSPSFSSSWLHLVCCCPKMERERGTKVKKQKNSKVVLRVLEHVQYNYSVHWQGKDQSVPPANPLIQIQVFTCHLVEGKIKHHLIILLAPGSISRILGLSLKRVGGCFKPTLCQSAPFGLACVFLFPVQDE